MTGFGPSRICDTQMRAIRAYLTVVHAFPRHRHDPVISRTTISDCSAVDESVCVVADSGLLVDEIESP